MNNRVCNTIIVPASEYEELLKSKLILSEINDILNFAENKPSKFLSKLIDKYNESEVDKTPSKLERYLRIFRKDSEFIVDIIRKATGI